MEEVVNKTWNRWGRCKDTREETFNAILGLAAESGEVADLFKKGFFHKELSEQETARWLDHLISELGDVIYYWIKLADIFDISTEEILAANREKLFARLADPEFTGQAGGSKSKGESKIVLGEN